MSAKKGFTVYTRKDSPYYYAGLWDVALGGYRYQKTEFRKDEPSGKRKALLWASEQSRLAESVRKDSPEELWHHWVPDFLDLHYPGDTKTGQRYRGAWKKLYEFLIERELFTPRHVKYKHAAEYVTWRTGQKRPNGNFINRNTALDDLKVLMIVMQEALRREYCDGNPIYRLKLRKGPVKHATPMKDAEIAKVRAAVHALEGGLPVTERWRTVSFEIALHHGCRLSETQVPMNRVSLVPVLEAPNGTITFVMKGGKVHTVPLHPALAPLIRQLQEARATMTCTLPRMAAKEWWKLRRDLKLSHLRFHSTRSTVVTRMAEAGINQQQTQRYVNHASATVHRIYQQVSVAGVVGAGLALDYSSAKPSAPETPGAPAPTPQT